MLMVGSTRHLHLVTIWLTIAECLLNTSNGISKNAGGAAKLSVNTEELQKV